MKHFIPPWGDKYGPRFGAPFIERHSAKCRVLNVPFDTEPQALAVRLVMAPADLKELAARAADLASARYDQMTAYTPTDYDPNSYAGLRDRLLSDDFDHACLWGARGGGKSHMIAEVIVELASIGYEKVVGVREFMKSLDESVQELLVSKIKASKWAEDWQCLDNVLRNVRTGSKITFIGIARNPTAQKSMAGVTIVWCEECADLSATSIELLTPTVMREKNSRIFWSYNPEKLDTPVDVMFRQGEKPEGAIVAGVMPEDNIYFYVGKMAAERRTSFIKMSTEKFRWIWRGAYELRSELAVYQNWSIGRVDTSNRDLVPRYGIDFGWTDPFAAIEFYVIEPSDPEAERGKIYITNEIYQTKLPAKDIPGRLDDVMPMARSHTITADSSEPKSIDDLNTAGFHVVGAVKGPGSIRAGISVIQGYDIVVSPDCPNAASELSNYSWKTDKKGTILRDPEDTENHLMDPLRYGMEAYQPPAPNGGVVYLKRRR